MEQLGSLALQQSETSYITTHPRNTPGPGKHEPHPQTPTSPSARGCGVGKNGAEHFAGAEGVERDASPRGSRPTEGSPEGRQ